MIFFAMKDGCPECLAGMLGRIRRNGWMRFFPGSMKLRCGSCSACFMKLMGFVLIPLRK